MPLPAGRPEGWRSLRAADSDREGVAERLRMAAGDGRLTLEELDQRLEVVYAAKTYGELEELVLDLPGSDLASGTSDQQDTLLLSAPFNNTKREGRWRVPPRIVASAGLGTVKLDFTEAALTSPTIVVEAKAHVGDVVLLVPPGWRVDMENVRPGLGGAKNRTKGRSDPSAPLLRITGYCGAGNVVVRHPRASSFLPR